MIEQEVLDFFHGDHLAAQVWNDKYRLNEAEKPDGTVRRMVKEFRRIEEKYPNPLGEGYIYDMLKDFKTIIPAGSVISGIGSGRPVSLSNCFVIDSPEDSYSGIMKADEELVQIMKRRGGVGIDISTLRPSGCPVNNAAKTSTGAVSFAKRFADSTAEVAQNGRRGALMLTMDIRHPDVDQFITCKQDNTSMSACNISVRVSDKFMEKALKRSSSFIQTFPCDLNMKTVKLTEEQEKTLKETHEKVFFKLPDGSCGCARSVDPAELWNTLTTCATRYAEPGILFWDRFTEESMDSGYPEYRPISTNPCGELSLPAYDSCRLIHINLSEFVVNGVIDYDRVKEVASAAMRLGDDLIDLELEAVERIIQKVESSENPTKTELNLWRNIHEKAKSGRRAGVGILGLGDMLAKLGLAYGSRSAIQRTERVMRNIYNALLDESEKLGQERGCFYGHRERDARRNVSFSTVAPTGTIAILAQTTSGIEPLFSPYYTRRVKVVDGSPYDYVAESGEKFREELVVHPTMLHQMQEKGLPITQASVEEYYRQSPWQGSTAHEIDPYARVAMQSAVQKYTTHSISSTINLKAGTTEKEVQDIYNEAYGMNLKGITVYVDGSRDGVLIAGGKEKEDDRIAKKRDAIIPCDIREVKTADDAMTIAVGLVDGKPYEVFVASKKPLRFGQLFHVNNPAMVCGMRKDGKGKYSLMYVDGYVEGFPIDADSGMLTRLVSLALRHGIPIRFIYEQLLKASDGFTSECHAIAEVLKPYIEDGEESTLVCEHCGEKTVIFKDGCMICTSCGTSKCM